MRRFILVIAILSALVSMTAVLAQSGNLLTNGNMESGTTAWSVFGAGTLTSNTSVFHGGARSVLHTGRTASWNGPRQIVTSLLTNGTNYTTSVWVRTQSGTPSAKVTLQLTANGSTSYVTLAPAKAVNSTGWTQVDRHCNGLLEWVAVECKLLR